MRTRSLLLASVAAAVCAAPAASHAATISEEGGSYVFRAAPGEKNSMSLQGGKSGSGGGVTFYVGAGGVTITALPASCDDHRDWHYVECPTPSSGAVRLELGDGDDWFATSSDSELPKGLKIAVDGGEGDDRIDGWHQDETFTGGPGNDQLKSWLGDDALDGGDGDDTLTGAGGSDRLTGGAGNDLLAPDGYEEMATDVVDGGAGVDTIEADYSSRFVDLDPPVAITLGGGADDGRPGESDDLRSVERLILSVPGRIVGSDGPEYVKLHQVGGDGELIGNGGDDELRAGDGADRIDGGAGADKLDGGFGDDTIVGGPGRDQISADLAGGDCGPLWCKLPYGNDTVDARDGEADSVTCGAGTDKVLADAADTVAPDCETVERANGPVVPDGPKNDQPDCCAPPPAATVKLASAQRLRKALRSGVTLAFAGLNPGEVRVRLLHGGKVVARGTGTVAGDRTATVKVAFTAAAKRTLARKRTVRLSVEAGAVKRPLTLRR